MLNTLTNGDEMAKAERLKPQPIGRLGKAEKIANAVGYAAPGQVLF